MEIGSKQSIEILKSNFRLEVVETTIGFGVKMNAKEAFIFSIVTGAGYFDNPLYQFTPKGLMKLFYNAFDYKFVTGIFEHATLKHTPYILSKVKPYLFEGDKIIIPIEFESEIQLQSILKSFFLTLENPTNYIILRIEKSKKGNGMEGFMEYLIAEYFKNNGFIVENQIPLAHSVGSPDFGGYKLSETFKALNKKGIFLGNGFHIIELSLLRLFNYSTTKESMNFLNNAVVGEAKTSTTVMQKQLNKYLQTGLFEYGIEIHPSKQTSSSPEIGLFTINPITYKIEFHPPVKEFEYEELYSKNEYYKWLDNYMKFYLIANLNNDELMELVFKETSSRKFGQSELVDMIIKLPTEYILNYLEQMI